MIRKKPPRRESTAPDEFVDHCSKIVCCVCSVCGGKDLTDVDLIANKGKCLNSQCESQQQRIGRGGGQNGIVPLAPALDAIYGEMSIRDGGTGETAEGKDSASKVRRRILEKEPTGSRYTEREPGIREWAFGREIANRLKGFSDK